MTTELFYLGITAFLTGCLWIPVVIGFVHTNGILKRSDYAKPPQFDPLPDWIARANRAHGNAIENLVPFAVLVLIGHLAGVSNSITAGAVIVYFWARVAHVIIYISGFSYFKARTVVFTIGWLAFVAYGLALFGFIG